LRLGANPRLRRPVARLRQTGRMRQDAETAWSSFRAEQVISTLECAFEWRARTGPMQMIRVRDALQGGAGRLQARVFGLIPVARVGLSPSLTRGELMRYLAELAWAPDALLLNTALRWRELEGGNGLAVGAGLGDAAVEVRLSLNTDGRIGDAFAPDRPRAVDDGFVPTPWRGRFASYRLCEGVWTPLEAEVAWQIEGEWVTCWEGHVQEWTARPD
jgi:hypothetical protein